MVTAETLVFGVIALILLGAALMVVTGKNIVHSALYLVLSFGAVAAFYIVLQADFLAFVQILIYIGAVTVLLIFAVVLTYNANTQLSNPGNAQRLLAAFISLVLLVLIGVVLLNTVWPLNPAPFTGSTVALMGPLLYQTYALPFEIASVLLLVALIGAIILARED